MQNFCRKYFIPSWMFVDFFLTTNTQNPPTQATFT